MSSANLEILFIQKIDGRFPYDEAGIAEALVDEGCGISANAAFMVAHELVRRPRSSQTSDERCLELLSRMERQLDHPLKDVVLRLSGRKIRGLAVATADAIAAMKVVGQFTGQWNALNIVYFCVTDPSADVDAVYDEIVHCWERGSAVGPTGSAGGA